MLIRLVRLTLQPSAVKSFQRLFQAVAPQILQMQGCNRLELWVDSASENILTTYSEWDSETSLISYRESDLFKETWADVKPFFAAPAMAHSYYPAHLNR